MLQYKLKTVDGYILTIHRIPGSKGEKVVEALKGAKQKQVVLLCHGVSGSSWQYIVGGPGKLNEKQKVVGKAIPYQMADTGLFDVWMMNARGNYFSREHMWMDPDSDISFWDYSF